jgi:hypothetical protein
MNGIDHALARAAALLPLADPTGTAQAGSGFLAPSPSELALPRAVGDALRAETRVLAAMLNGGAR